MLRLEALSKQEAAFTRQKTRFQNFDWSMIKHFLSTPEKLEKLEKAHNFFTQLALTENLLHNEFALLCGSALAAATDTSLFSHPNLEETFSSLVSTLTDEKILELAKKPYASLLSFWKLW